MVKYAHDDAWIRDNGPTYVWDLRSKTLMGISWLFNAWGESIRILNWIMRWHRR